MYHLVKHRCFYYVYFADVKIQEGVPERMYERQAEREVQRLISLCYDATQ